MATALMTSVPSNGAQGPAFNSLLQDWSVPDGIMEDFLCQDVLSEFPTLKESSSDVSDESSSSPSEAMDDIPSYPVPTAEVGSEPFDLVYLSLDRGHVFDEEAQEQELAKDTSVIPAENYLFDQVKQEESDIALKDGNSPLRMRRDRILKGSLFEQLKEEGCDEDETSKRDNVEDEDFDDSPARKFPTPSNIMASKVTIGEWNWTNVEIKFLYGRRKIKYYVKGLNGDTQMMIDFDFSQIGSLKVDCEKKILKIELATLPNFIEKVSGRWIKATDFTHGNASLYRQHKITVPPAVFDKHILNLLQYDSQLRAVTESSEITSSPGPTFKPNVCDWDKENSATVHCDDCRTNYCDDCDEILHRHPDKKMHKRVSFTSQLKKSAKRKKKSRCRCGTGATKGTLGNPCTGNRCPCFSEGRKCTNCGCKHCNNPHNSN